MATLKSWLVRAFRGTQTLDGIKPLAQHLSTGLRALGHAVFVSGMTTDQIQSYAWPVA